MASAVPTGCRVCLLCSRDLSFLPHSSFLSAHAGGCHERAGHTLDHGGPVLLLLFCRHFGGGMPAALGDLGMGKAHSGKCRMHALVSHSGGTSTPAGVGCRWRRSRPCACWVAKCLLRRGAVTACAMCFCPCHKLLSHLVMFVGWQLSAVCRASIPLGMIFNFTHTNFRGHSTEFIALLLCRCNVLCLWWHCQATADWLQCSVSVCMCDVAQIVRACIHI